MQVIVFGGTGFVGKNMQSLRPEWLYVGRNKIIENGIEYEWSLDLTDEYSVDHFFKNFSFDDFCVLNLAGVVGGIFFNMSNQNRIMYENIEINKNIFHFSKMYGASKIITSLSTCAWPDQLDKYPYSELDILEGSPPFTNGGYANAKRIAYFEHLLARSEGFNSVCFAPCNLYGPHDNAGPNSHLVSSAVEKILNSKTGESVLFKGDGKPLRQHLYVEDLCKVISDFIVPKYGDQRPLIVSHHQNLSIKEICYTIRDVIGKDVNIEFDGIEKGQYNKESSSAYLKSMYSFNPRSFEVGVYDYLKWLNKKPQ